LKIHYRIFVAKKKNLEKKNAPSTREDFDSENEKEWAEDYGDKEEEDHELVEILKHRKKASTGQGEITGSKLYKYLVKFNPPKPDGKNTK
jgi:hypothetical protein